eukprot:gnl/TRDRNA2_/TRDRNA2_154320_c0_seq2.p1 gnl/TRDRNA2_/TRDRNA2_154320_c0~~gnl/TRDRNA2_/TRDRNA2_154320_c0_seq2.p1  ORF type:complete len:702 (-),score=118.50 gnl/TRDRNA2_/TRDRNA2_154320_c0_seq2:69-1871(-)
MDQSRQPLTTLLEAEKRGDQWKKVRIRARGSEPEPGTTGPSDGGGSGLWSLASLAPAAASGPSRHANRRKARGDAPAPPQAEFRDAAGFWEDQPRWSEPARPKEDIRPQWPEPARPKEDFVQPDSEPPKAPSMWETALAPPLDKSADFHKFDVPPDEPPTDLLEHVTLEPKNHDSGNVNSTLEPEAMKRNVDLELAAPAKEIPETPYIESPSLSSSRGRRRQSPRTPPPIDTDVASSAEDVPDEREPDRDVREPWRPGVVPPSSARPQAASTDREPSAATAPEQQRPRRPATRLEDALPEAAPGEHTAVAAADEALRAAVVALEMRSHSIAATAFRSALVVLDRQVSRGPRGTPSPSPAMRARFEAAAAYNTLCSLLRKCEELRKIAAAATSVGQQADRRHGGGVDPALLRQLCHFWVCVLRISKAPRHTALFALQAMATFFTYARPVGGWLAARQLAFVLLERCTFLLSKEELAQVEHVQQATAVGEVARGAPGMRDAEQAAVCGACPSCRRPLELLSPSCNFCGAEVGVCTKELRLCDARRAAVCTLCASMVGTDKGSGEAGIGGGSRSRPASRCLSCGLGEMHPRGAFRHPGEVLAY